MSRRIVVLVAVVVPLLSACVPAWQRIPGAAVAASVVHTAHGINREARRYERYHPPPVEIDWDYNELREIPPPDYVTYGAPSCSNGIPFCVRDGEPLPYRVVCAWDGVPTCNGHGVDCGPEDVAGCAAPGTNTIALLRD